MEEQLISFKTAKLAKEKGFHECVEYFYNKKKYDLKFSYLKGIASLTESNNIILDRGFDEEYILDDYNIDLEKYRFPGNIGNCTVSKEIIENHELFSAPTQSLLQKFLRETHKIYIEIHCKLDSNKYDNIKKEPKYFGVITSNNHKVSNLKCYNFTQVFENMEIDNDCEENPPAIFSNYEKALEKTLLEALKLIKINYGKRNKNIQFQKNK